MTFEDKDLNKTNKQLIKEFNDWKTKNGNCQNLVDIMNKLDKYHHIFSNFYGKEGREVSCHDGIIIGGDNKLPKCHRNKQGILTLTIPGWKSCGNYFSFNDYQIITGWYYVLDIPRAKMQNASKATLTKFVKYLIDWNKNFYNAEKADSIWAEFEKFCVDKMDAKIR